MANQNERSWVERLGRRVSEWVADLAAHPLAQIGVILFCALWWTIGLPTDILTAALSILAITLTQMVLNRQNEREMDDHRRDVAMHAKLDELISASRRARNDLVGIEERDEEEIVQLKEEVKEAIEQSAAAADPEVQQSAKEAVEEAADELTKRTERRPHAAKSKNTPAKG